ncbi:unnamed protein product, partial [Sphacelaria rigidula]
MPLWNSPGLIWIALGLSYCLPREAGGLQPGGPVRTMRLYKNGHHHEHINRHRRTTPIRTGKIIKTGGGGGGSGKPPTQPSPTVFDGPREMLKLSRMKAGGSGFGEGRKASSRKNARSCAGGAGGS